MDKLDVAERYTVGETDTAFDDIVSNAELYPDTVAVSRSVAGGWSPVTCRALAAEITALAGGLIEEGVSAGDRVAILSRTRYEWLLADFAVMSAGAITVPIYETSADAQIEWILSDSGAVAVFTEDEEHAARVRALQGRLPALRQVWTFPADLSRLTGSGQRAGSSPVTARRAAVRARDIATIVYTSGTTGQPKGCVLTHANLVAAVRNVTAADGVTERVFNEDQSTLLFLPLAHILARIIQCSALHARVRLGHQPDMKDVPAGLRSFRPTVVLSVPRVFEKIYNTAQRTASSGAKARIFAASERTAIAYSRALEGGGRPNPLLRAAHGLFDVLVYRKLRAAMGGQVRWAVSGGAPLGAKLGHFFRGVGVTVLEGYGLTETTAGGTLNLPALQRVGSVGRPIPGCAIRTDTDGELLMRGPHVLSGYWHNDAATREVLDEEGWFRTGDIGRIDEDGFVFITDRKKDLIVTSAGKNVAPTMLEDRLRAGWLISQAAVFGDQRPYISALLTLDPEALAAWREQHGKADLPPDALAADPELLAELQKAVDAANEPVSPAEAIKRWRVLATDFTEATGELTPTMKLKRNVVAERYAAEVELLYS